MSVLLFLVKLTISGGAFYGLSDSDFLPVKERVSSSGQPSFSLQDFSGGLYMDFTTPRPQSQGRGRGVLFLIFLTLFLAPCFWLNIGRI